MKIIDCEQGTEAWFNARLAIPTASCFDKIITPGGKPSKSSVKYLYALLAEWATGRPADEASSGFMTRGIDMEEEAVSFYSLDRDVDTETVGFCLTDDGTAGCSPDRLVGDKGLLEVKCPALTTHIGYFLAGGVEDDYLCQTQGQLWVTGREWLDIISYNPLLRPVIIRVARDERFIAALASALAEFNDRLADAKARILATGFQPVELRAAVPEHGPIPSDILA